MFCPYRKDCPFQKKTKRQRFDLTAEYFSPSPPDNNLVGRDSPLSPGESREVYRRPSIATDVGVPLAWSLVGSLVISLPVTAVSLIAGTDWRIPLIGWSAVFAGLWLKKSIPDLMNGFDVLVMRARNMSSPEAAPATADVPVVRVAVQQEKRMTVADLPASDRWIRFWRQVVESNGASFTEEMAERFSIPISGNESFRAVRERIMERGWGNWRNPENHRSGFSLNRAGLAACRRIVEWQEM